MSTSAGVARRSAVLEPIAIPVMTIEFCPFCGHATYEDSTAEKLVGVCTVICPVDRLRFVYSEWTRKIEVERL